MKNDYTIRRETSADLQRGREPDAEAFCNVYRPGCLEHFVLHRYRTRPDFIPELSLCLIVDGRIIAHVMYAHAEIHADDGRIVPILTFGPISVSPDSQHQGHSRILLQHSMEKAKETRCRSAGHHRGMETSTANPGLWWRARKASITTRSQKKRPSRTFS